MTILQEHIQAQLQTLPEIATWPEIINVFKLSGAVPRPDWEIPLLSCEASGGDPAAAIVGAAAIACLQVSIMLVDDMLDDDPRGEHLRRGVGNVANMAMALQAAAICLVTQATVSDTQRAKLSACLANATLATSAGQQLDTQNLMGEANYWKQVDAKSTPFYGAAYQIGGILAGVNTAVATELYRFGKIIGEIIQIEDDLHDALQTPVNADWQQGRNNLLILYARTASHSNKAKFEQLLSVVACDPTCLAEAQQILISSGAVSYAVYQMIERYKAAQIILESMTLSQPKVMQNTLDKYAKHALLPLLQSAGSEISLDALQETLAI